MPLSKSRSRLLQNWKFCTRSVLSAVCLYTCRSISIISVDAWYDFFLSYSATQNILLDFLEHFLMRTGEDFLPGVCNGCCDPSHLTSHLTSHFRPPIPTEYQFARSIWMVRRSVLVLVVRVSPELPSPSLPPPSSYPSLRRFPGQLWCHSGANSGKDSHGGAPDWPGQVGWYCLTLTLSPRW